MASVATAAAASTLISSLVAGTYTFRLTVTDNNGATGYDDVIVNVAVQTLSASGKKIHVNLEKISMYSKRKGISTV